MRRYKLLLAEDEAVLAGVIKDFLERNAWDVEVAGDGEETLALYAKFLPDILLMDVDMPRKNGFEVMEEIRVSDYVTPIILMTGSMMDDASIARGYELGAVNYEKKPVSPQVILSILNAKMKSSVSDCRLTIGDKVLILDKQILKMGDVSLCFREREAMVLQVLMKNANELVSKKKLLDMIWGNDLASNLNMLDGLISSLRRALSIVPELEIKSHYGRGIILKTR